MQKYNYELDLTTLNSNSIIIKHLEENKEVLEFGPAFGRLTKYLKETLSCEVDIVEIDEEAGSAAQKYARYSCIGIKEGNIDEMRWAEKLHGNKYDYIIFADVLEHLKNPEIVLSKCKDFLKDNGKILCSVPNIAHSSVILSLWNDDFTYSDVGLLDNTHIRFFTRKTFEKMARNIGLRVSSVEEVVSEVGNNEIHYGYDSVPKVVQAELHFRREGNIYQYVFELVKNSCFMMDTIYNCGNSSGYECMCFFKQIHDADYLPTKCIKKRYPSRNVTINFDFTKIDFVEGVCVTLIETSSVIRIDKIILNGNCIEFSTNGYNILKNYYYFINNSQVFISGKNEYIKEIILEFEIISFGPDKLISEIISTNADNQKEVSILQENLISKEEEILVLQDNLLSKEKEVKYLSEKLKCVQNENIFDKLIKKIKD